MIKVYKIFLNLRHVLNQLLLLRWLCLLLIASIGDRSFKLIQEICINIANSSFQLASTFKFLNCHRLACNLRIWQRNNFADSRLHCFGRAIVWITHARIFWWLMDFNVLQSSRTLYVQWVNRIHWHVLSQLSIVISPIYWYTQLSNILLIDFIYDRRSFLLLNLLLLSALEAKLLIITLKVFVHNFFD